MNDSSSDEIKRLKWENTIWIVFAFLCLLNIAGDNDEINYLRRNNINFKREANTIFEFTLTITFLIYLYFFTRNVNQLEKNQDKKELYEIKVFGSIFLIFGIICLIYFQKKQKNFTGSPAL